MAENRFELKGVSYLLLVDYQSRSSYIVINNHKECCLCHEIHIWQMWNPRSAHFGQWSTNIHLKNLQNVPQAMISNVLQEAPYHLQGNGEANKL